VAYLRGGLAAGETVHVDAADRQELAQAALLHVRSLRGQTDQKKNDCIHPLPDFRASSSWYSTRRPVRASRDARTVRISPFSTRSTSACWAPAPSTYPIVT